ncbi:semaphorin-4A-like [Myxocyprinus asiaticus]|uniref:semaphorin-4A-like n=1 Tax=Myxocyprinus asiaticus TaxID=70543 RepID=UPI002223C151|nr:semaphorin-4A-like [Myxocyprinus asiaticus]
MIRAGSDLKSSFSMAGLFNIWTFIVLVFGSVDSFQASLLPPRMSFPHGSPERVLGIYHSSTVKNSTTLLLSTDAHTLFVGARDAVLSLDVSQPDNITLKDKLDWTASKDNLNRCTTASKTDCGNFIRILQFFNSTHLYVCGTNAYGPQGIIIPASSLSANRDTKDAKNCCPYSSTQKNTAIIVDEELYTATNVGFFGDKRVIARCLSKGTRNNLVLESVPKLLNDPLFISSTHIGSEGKVLLFFTEVGDLKGDSFVNSFTVSRVAQVCTDDKGGNRVLQKRWTSFAKAQLVCQQGQELQFNMLQDIVTLSPPDNESPDSTLFYGVFTPQWSSSSGLSAVCAFSLTDIKEAFSGDYKTYDIQGNYWSRQPNTYGKLGKCGLFNDSDSMLNTVKKSFLTEKPVHPVGKKLLLSSTEERYSRLAAQRTQAANGRSYTLLYLLTESGFLHKVVLLSKGSHIIEEIQVFKQPQTMKNILLSTSKGVLFIGSSEGVFSVPVSNCSAYPNCAECVLARDPFCGWDSETRECTTVSSIGSNLHQDVEGGNVRENCVEFKNTAAGPATVTQIVQFNEIVVLPCPLRSRLAEVTWRFANNSVVSQFPYLQQTDGSLTFRVTPDTVNTYSCVSEELDFKQTIATFSVILPFQPRSHFDPTYQQPGIALNKSKDTEVEPIPEYYTTHGFEESNPTKWKTIDPFITTDRGSEQARTNPINTSGKAVCISQKSYYTEMVAFCFLFVMCLCVFAAFVVLWWHSMRCSRTTPQKPPKNTETDNIWLTELEENKTPTS